MWQRLQLREKIMLAVLGFTCLCFILFKFLLIPQFIAYGENKDILADLRLKVQVAEAVVRSQNQEIDLARRVNEQLNELNPLFNNDMNDGLALVHIGLIAVESNVEIISFVPSAIVNKTIYLELPAKFEVRGDYRDVINFIGKIEALPDLSELRTLKIEPFKEKIAAAPAASAQKRTSPEEAPAEVISLQDGRVVATFDIVTFTSPSPEARLYIEQVLSWAVGRCNAFLTPDITSPCPGIKPLDSKGSVYSTCYQ